MNSWSINGIPAASLSIEDIHLTHASWGEGRATFRCAGLPLGSAPPFAVGSVVVLTNPAGQIRFSGPVLKQTPTGSAAGEAHDYTVAGPGYWAERTTYLQTWQMNGGAASTSSSRVILGVNQVNGHWGEPIPMGEAVAKIIGFMESLGLPVAAGTIDLPGYFKVTELNGVSCLEAIKSICKWQPDAVAYWTYGTPNKLNIVRRATLGAVYQAIDGMNVTSAGFTARLDLVPAAVSVLYEQVATIDGHQYPTYTLDTAPPGDNGAGLNKLHYTVPLQGANYRFLKERIVTRTMHLAPVTDYAATCRYVGAKLGLNGVATSIAGVTPPAAQLAFFPVDNAGNYFGTLLADPTETDGSQDPLAEADAATRAEDYYQGAPNTAYEGTAALAARKITLDPTLTRELLHGIIRPWMGEKAQKQIVWCLIQYSLPDGTVVGPEWRSFHVMATSATSRIYAELDSAQLGETPPMGVAAQIYEALKTPQYEGTLELEEAECSASVQLGHVLNVPGGAPEWATMNAVVQTVSEDIARGHTRITCGPPAHLGIGDFIELQRTVRSMVGLIGQDFRNVWRMASGYV